MLNTKNAVVLFLLLFCGQVFAAPIAEVEYFYSQDGTLIGRAVNGKRLNYEYDLKGQLLAVKDTSGKVIEQYVYDPAGNILSKTIESKTTTFTYDEANQLLSSTCEGKTTTYEYDAAGRLVREGSKTYSYGYLDKILEVQENGKQVAAFDYHVDGQVASATYSDRTESFVWDGLALIRRNENTFINEPHVTGGNPILSSKDGVMFNDMLGNTLSVNGKTVDMTAFGATSNPDAMFTGKPYIGELGYAFLFRNYRADNGKWQTADPLGYPDGWNNLAYVNNGVTNAIDFAGAAQLNATNFSFHSGNLSWPNVTLPSYVNSEVPTAADSAMYAYCMTNAVTLGLGFQYGDNARHYLQGTGETVVYSSSFVDGFFSTANITTFQNAITSYVKAQDIANGKSIVFSTQGDFMDADATSTDPDPNHWLSNQGFRYGLTGLATMNAIGTSIRVEYEIVFHDYYQFFNTNLTAGLLITDNDWRRLAVVGYASPYTILGESTTKYFTIELE